MTEITNEHGIDILALAWLLVDDYDHDSGKDIAPKGKLLSASQLLKSTKAIVLSKRVDYSTEVMDISERSSSCIGQSLHNAVEGVWTSGQYKESLKLANIPQDIIDKTDEFTRADNLNDSEALTFFADFPMEKCLDTLEEAYNHYQRQLRNSSKFLKVCV